MNKDDLDAILNDIWKRWTNGKRDRHSPLHTPVIGTADGNLRVLVLREVDVKTATLRFHTDVRTSKVEQIRRASQATLLGYDPVSKIQIRGWGLGQVETATGKADSAWAASAPSSRRCYLANYAPGSASVAPSSGLPTHVESRVPTIAETQPGRANFAILLIQLYKLEWLYLAHDGHRRAQFERQGGGWAGRWLIP